MQPGPFGFYDQINCGLRELFREFLKNFDDFQIVQRVGTRCRGGGVGMLSRGRLRCSRGRNSSNKEPPGQTPGGPDSIGAGVWDLRVARPSRWGWTWAWRR